MSKFENLIFSSFDSRAKIENICALSDLRLFRVRRGTLRAIGHFFVK